MYNYQKEAIGAAVNAMLADLKCIAACIKRWFLYIHASFYKGKMRARFYFKHGMIDKERLPHYVNARPEHRRIDWIYRSRNPNFWDSGKAHTYEGRGR